MKCKSAIDAEEVEDIELDLEAKSIKAKVRFHHGVRK
jgi:hypothetical protein